MTLAIILAMLLAAVIAYTIAITSHTEPDSEPLIDPQYCRQCGAKCRSTYCLDCQIADADGPLLGSGYRPSAWCPRCHAPHRAEANKCPECALERDL